MSMERDTSDVSLSYRQVQLEKVVEHHEERITQNEKFRIEAWAVLRFVGFIAGGGIGAVILLNLI